jgi:SRSO17 transposase
VQFQSNIDLALGMIARAASAEIPGDVILADAAYGGSATFRNTVRVLGFDYAVQVRSSTLVVTLNEREQKEGRVRSLLQLAQYRGRTAFRRYTWREGTKQALSSKFLFARVKTAGDDGFTIDEHEPVWAVIEWPDDEPTPTKCFLTTLPRRLSKKQIVRTIKERWRTERMYEDLKGELGLDHFEGRSFPGWHHHVSVVLCCYAFVVAERARTFPPSPQRSRSRKPVEVAAGAPLRGLVRNGPPRDRANACSVAAPLPAMPPAPPAIA